MKYKFKMLEDENWWGGSSNNGKLAPYNKKSDFARDFRRDTSNQTMPMFLSDKGRCIWSEEPFSCTIRGGVFYIEGEGVTLETFGSTLKDAYLGAMNAHFRRVATLWKPSFSAFRNTTHGCSSPTTKRNKACCNMPVTSLPTVSNPVF